MFFSPHQSIYERSLRYHREHLYSSKFNVVILKIILILMVCALVICSTVASLSLVSRQKRLGTSCPTQSCSQIIIKMRNLRYFMSVSFDNSYRGSVCKRSGQVDNPIEIRGLQTIRMARINDQLHAVLRCPNR